MQFNFNKKIKAMRQKPLSQMEKDALWSKIEAKMASGRGESFYSQGFFNLFSLNRKFAFASFLATFLIVGSGATVAASNSAKPGDLLFPIDTVVERVQIAFSSGEKKEKLKLEFAEERLDEAKQVLTSFIATSEKTISQEQATTSQQIQGRYSKHVVQAEEALAFALDYLEEVKDELNKEDSNSSSTIAAIISELTDLAQNHVSDLTEIKTKIDKDGDRLKIKIETSGGNIKSKFKIVQKEKKDEDKDEDKNERDGEEDDDEDEDDEEDDDEDRDQTAPVISNITSTASTSTADISWSTNETANSKIWYGTATPLVVSSATLSISSANLVAFHALKISNLTASTTYHFIVVSADTAGNSATSTERSFMTLIE